MPGRNLELKRKVIRDINSWDDVDLVVCTGDICATVGTEEEYAFAAEFFSELKKPFITIIGNHDNFYSDSGYFRASATERREKLQRFLRNFPDQRLFYSDEFAGLRFYFLAVDDVTGPYFSSISAEQISWFEAELERHRQQKSIVFCHAPLWTDEILQMYPQAINYIVQPAEEFKRIIAINPQVSLWVSGHVHFGMKAELINHPFNLYNGRVTNILNCDMDGFSVLDLKIKPEFHDKIWTRKLILNSEKYICTVYDHQTDKELTGLKMTGNI